MTDCMNRGRWIGVVAIVGLFAQHHVAGQASAKAVLDAAAVPNAIIDLDWLAWATPTRCSAWRCEER